MSPLKTSLIAALLSVVLTAGGFWYFDQTRAREAGWLQAQNNRMRMEASRRHLAQAPASPLAVPAGSIPAGVATSTPVAAEVPAPPPAEYYRNEGNVTPLAALQTFAWACDRGDTEMVGRLLHIDPAARPKAEAFRAALPEKIRAQWKSVDEMAVALLTRSIMARPFPNADILETATIEPLSEDRVRLRLPDVPKDGTEYQKTADGWKYVLTEKVVDDYIRQSREQNRP